MKDADKTHSGVNVTCGDHVRVYLKFSEGGVIEEASWEGEGCAISVAAASLLTEQLKGKTVTEAKALTKEDILKMLEITELGPGRMKCVTLCLETLQGAFSEDQ